MSLRRPTAERSRDTKNYNIYCINFHGSGLNTIKNEFKHQVQMGLRRSVFILDLEDIQQNLDSQPRTSKQLRDYQDNPNNHLIAAILQNIQDLRKEYDVVTKRISDELKFDLYQYWLKDIEDKLVESLVDSVSLKGKISLNVTASTKGRQNRDSKASKGTRSSKKSVGRQSSLLGETEAVTCMPLLKKEHNRVGQLEMVSKRKYIKDDPPGGKMYFIILGSMNRQFYADLLSRDQAVQGIINFIPAESNYEILLNNNKLRNFILQTLGSINTSVYQLRQETALKSVGIFTHELPIISKCLATKYQRDIYDQLTWSVYDIEMLQQQYHNYYYRPFQETDVQLPLSVDLHQLYDVATSLSLQGHFQKHPLTGSAPDVSTILAYVDSLLNTCGLPDNILSEKEIILLSMTDYNLPKSNTVINELIKSSKSAFVSITKIRKFERLFIEESNMMMVDMLQYADQDMFRNIYLSCLDSNLWRKYVTSLRPRELLTNIPPSSGDKLFDLPGIVKLYTSEDSCCQKILELSNTYDDVQIKELQPDCKLYTFRRTYNFICENEQLDVIPTRLCFRDFTLFQMEEFLENLITPETRRSSREEARRSSLSIGKKSKAVDLEENVFIRPNSLKAIKLSTEKESEQSQTQRERDQRSSRKRSTLYGRKSSSRLTEEWVGLPPGHHLIKGYNLEDIRQEVQSKTSKYLYHHGFIQLYEEKWCFQDTNKTLTFDINNCKMHLTRPRSQESGILNNIRLETSNNVGIRILNEAQECARIVMNYPNGLSIYYHDMDCEQVWSGETSFRNEMRRIITPHGAVVVFYQADYMIMIMRYNGEIYKLYQYEFPEEEEEDMLSEFSNNHSSEIIDNKAQGDNQTKLGQKVEHVSTKDLNHGQGDNNVKPKVPRANPNNPSKPEPAAAQASEESVNAIPSLSPRSVTDDLKASVEYELSFLSYIASTYNLSYLHLKMTTSQGRRINLALDGKIFEATPCKLEEWHDYYANESYSLRSDGVKMIWTQDALKCYHKDGSVFTTKTQEGFESLDENEFEFRISQSSSHQQVEEEDMAHILKSPTQISIATVKGFPARTCEKEKLKYQDYLAPEEGEEPEDTRYIGYSCSSWLMQHHHYAGVYFVWTRTSHPPQSPVLMEILGIDNIYIYASKEESPLFNDESLEKSSDTEKNIGGDTWNRLLVNVWLSDNLHFTVDREGCEIFAVMERLAAPDEEEEDFIRSDSLTLKVLFKDCLTDVFKYLIKQIATFQNYNGPMTQELYFVEIQGKDCQRKGFEFLTTLPESSHFQHHSGNCMIEAKPLKTIDESMTCSIEGYEKDMKKFPRFRKDNSQKPLNSKPEFPMVLTTSIYCRVPSSLRNIQNVCKYLEPFENINFKKLRSKFRQLLDCYLRTQLQLDVKILYSSNNWWKRHREHERRKFTETQRLGLYHAMLKHRKYPNYFKFTQDYRGHVSDIDFFEFMQCKCENQEVQRDEVYWKTQNEGRNTKSQSANKANSRNRNKCLYGTYDK